LPTPSILAAPTAGCAPLTVAFSSPVVAGSTYAWNFGNGNTGTGANPSSQIYSSNGSYSVSLTVTTSFGCISTITNAGLINVSPPVASFTSNLINGCAPLAVTFSSTSTTPNTINNPITSWVWNFGDGTPNFNGQNPPPHNYPVGIFSPTLTITTQNGCTSTITSTNMISVGSIQSVNFSLLPPIQCAKTPVQFTSAVVFNGTPNPGEVTYAWDFGDGGTSTQPNPSYSYTADTGFMDVQLIVTWRGCPDTIIIQNAVYINAPISLFTLSSSLFCNPASLPVNLNVTDNAINGQLSDDVLITWKWGDGTPNTVLDDPQVDDTDLGSTSHAYTAYGTYTIWQVVQNFTTGCADSTNQTINVSQTIANFIFTNDSVCVNSPVTLTSTSNSTHPWGSFSYNMGNGATANGSPTSYAYPTFGAFNITLTATNSVGCSGTNTFIGMDALALPSAGINPTAVTGCVPITVTYTNTSSLNNNGLPLNTFNWTFPNGSTAVTNSILTTTNYTFLTEGSFTTQLIATDNFGCISAPTTVNMFITKPEANFSVDSVICNLETFNAINSSVGAISYQWFMDGPQVATSQDYSSSFNNSSSSSSVTHVLSLIATDINGCRDTITRNVIVSLPIAGIGVNLSGANVNGMGQFTCPPVFGGFTDNSNSYGDVTAYQWTFDVGIGSNLENPSNTYVFAGTYDLGLTITDEFGCSDDTLLVDFLTVNGPSGTPQWSSVGDICGQQFNFFATNLNSVSTIIWDFGDGTTADTLQQFTHTYEDYTTYQPSATLIDSLGCEIIYQLVDLVVIPNGLNAVIFASPEMGSIGTEFTFTNSSTSVNNPIVDYAVVILGDTLHFANNFSFQQQMGPTGVYPITLIVTDANGCIDEMTIYVTVDNNFTLPNVISANNDGVNDLFVLPAIIFKSYDIYILNRWGQIVHKAENKTGTLLWDGFTDAGLKSNDGVYFYKLRGFFADDSVINLEGFVSVTANN
jgi:PKD repeat protein